MVTHNRSSTVTTTSTTTCSASSELLICLSSRLSSSSSMRIAKSILSPDKFRDPPQIPLSSSLSRRLRTSGSLKGGQSPMFPTGGKKRGGGFDNPEPSSPKVTCIGQVRVKSKNKGKKIRSRSQRRGDVSFRKLEGGNNGQDLKRQNSGYRGHHQISSTSRREDDRECFPPSSHNGSNQKWIHIPVTICETIRAFGSELNCFLPCRSSCSSSGKEDNHHHRDGSGNGGNNNSSCGTVFARWLVAVQEGEGGRGREIELMVGGDEGGVEYRRSCQRRHVMEGIDFTKIDENPWEDNSEKGEEGMVSICVPPKNALLLMRCRSDPMRMAALASKVWECPIDKEDVEGIDEEEEEEEEYEECQEAEDRHQHHQSNPVQEKEAGKDDENNINMCEKGGEVEHSVEDNPPGEEESSLEMLKDEDFQDALVEETIQNQEEEEVSSKFVGTEEKNDVEEDNEPSKLQMARISVEGSLGIYRLFEEPQQQEKVEEAVKDLLCSEERERVLESERAAQEESTPLVPEEEEEEEHHCQQSGDGEAEEERRPSSVLPDCLLLMMCEPKLSMEVSKETWVCSADFVRWLPERKVKPEIKVNVISSEEGEDQQLEKNRVSIDCNAAEKVKAPPSAKSQHRAAQKQANKFLPPRSSCSYPAPPASMAAAALEQKLASAYEPFVLTRCKSEPMRSAAAAKYAPTDACFWKNRKLEPHRGAAAIRIGAAGIGF